MKHLTQECFKINNTKVVIFNNLLNMAEVNDITYVPELTTLPAITTIGG